MTLAFSNEYAISQKKDDDYSLFNQKIFFKALFYRCFPGIFWSGKIFIHNIQKVDFRLTWAAVGEVVSIPIKAASNDPEVDRWLTAFRIVSTGTRILCKIVS